MTTFEAFKRTMGFSRNNNFLLETIGTYGELMVTLAGPKGPSGNLDRL